MPILVGLSPIFAPSRITEFGSGLFSTALFLNKKVFPRVATIESFEDQSDWYSQIVGTLQDSRMRVTLVPESVPEAASWIPLSQSDLIFIDDSQDATTRSRTVRQVARRVPMNTPVVIHDFELLPLRVCSRYFDHSFCFNVFNPQTAVAWNGPNKYRKELRLLHQLLIDHQNIDPTDIPSWTRILHR
jgi:hypothetical protein